MRLDNFLQFLIPKDKKFYPLFESASSNLVHASKVLCELVNSNSQERRRELIKEIESLEHTGDNITHMIFNELGTNFITPFDREDIQALASALDDVIDYIHGFTKRIDIYKIEVMSPAMIKLSELIFKGAQELNVAVCELKSMKNTSNIKEACIKINSIENHADDVFNSAIGRLFEEEKDAIKLIKIKELLSVLETATDKCEDAANILTTILVKTT
jgi:uncharacterized protein